MQLASRLPQAHHTHLVFLFIFVSQAARLTRCHSIDADDATTQEISSQARPNVRWLSVRTAAKSETQLGQPPVAKGTHAPAKNTAAPGEHPDPRAQAAGSHPAATITPSPVHENAITPTASERSSTTTHDPSWPTTGANWIAKILTSAEQASLNEQQQREQLLNRIIEERITDKLFGGGVHVDPATVSEYVPSQAPTDSDEDPLESPLVTTLSSVSTDFALEPSKSAGAKDEEPSSSRDQAVLESNNVSAVLAITANDEDKLNIIVTMASRQTLNCEQAYHQCSQRTVCAQALQVYNEECVGLISGWTNVCSAKCSQAMIALRSSEEGDNLVNCDCQNNEYCLQNRNRSSICQPEVDKAIQPKSIVSCSTASAICMADQLCSTALEYYYQNCQTLFSQRQCSMRCNNSLAILYRQPKASKLIDCQCDGTEEFPCAKYKSYTERLCLNKHPKPAPKSHFDDDDVTNDGSRRTNMAVDIEATESVVPNEDDEAHPANSDENNLNPAGELADEYAEGGTVQPSGVEDNWIPLVSGRFFTNLQQQQQLGRVGQNQHRKAGNHQQASGTRHQKKLRNGARQKGRSNEAAGRPYVFALASSTASPEFLFNWKPILLSVLLLAVCQNLSTRD